MRLHLFEFEDLEWWPQRWRDYVTDYLSFMLMSDETYEPVVEPLAQAFRRSGAERIVDFCSGACGTSLFVFERVRAALGDSVEIVLSDKFPNLAAFKAATERVPNCRYIDESVDVTRGPADLDGFRTIFTALHHFQPEQVVAIFANAVARRSPIATFEFTERKASQIAMGAAIIPFLSWFATLRIRPVTAGRLLWTYLLPIVPLTCTWDGVVSSIRSYEPDELLKFAAAADPGQSYTWDVVRSTTRPGHAPFRTTSFIGLPK
jgi:hypothetical protein